MAGIAAAPYSVAPILAALAVGVVAATLTAGLIARRGFPLPQAAGRIGFVDGLRGYLALSVMAHHFILWLLVSKFGIPFGPPSVIFFNELGNGAVALFFMTTGAVFYPRVLKGFKACNWPTIYISRAFRILPLASFAVMLVVLAIVIMTGALPDRRLPLAFLIWISGYGEPPLLGYQQAAIININVLWSLWYEWVFYIVLLPACAIAMDCVRGRLPSWSVPLALALAGLAGHWLHLPFLMTNFMPLFAGGMLAVECRASERIAPFMRNRLVGALALAGLAFMATRISWSYTKGLPFMMPFFACVVCGNPLFSWLNTRGAQMLGEVSYSIYLLHGIVLFAAFTAGSTLVSALTATQLTVALPGLMIAVVCLTALSFLAIERPSIAAGRRLARRLVAKTD